MGGVVEGLFPPAQDAAYTRSVPPASRVLERRGCASGRQTSPVRRAALRRLRRQDRAGRPHDHRLGRWCGQCSVGCRRSHGRGELSHALHRPALPSDAPDGRGRTPAERLGSCARCAGQGRPKATRQDHRTGFDAAVRGLRRQDVVDRSDRRRPHRRAQRTHRSVVVRSRTRPWRVRQRNLVRYDAGERPTVQSHHLVSHRFRCLRVDERWRRGIVVRHQSTGVCQSSGLPCPVGQRSSCGEGGEGFDTGIGSSADDQDARRCQYRLVGGATMRFAGVKRGVMQGRPTTTLT